MLKFYPLPKISYRLFDISLRDGLQSLNPESQKLIKLADKIAIYNKIINEFNPSFIEIGSIVSPKLLPIMSDSLQLLEHVSDQPYLLVPSLNKMKILQDVNTPFNISLITSVSNSFQQKNINKSLVETKEEIASIIRFIKSMKRFIQIKLYISCISHCPIEGKINNLFIAKEINWYYINHKMIQNICLSDTCANLTFKDFKEIIDVCIYYYFIPVKLLSLHLHINKYKMKEIIQIFNYAMDCGINVFDVSIFNDLGGCSMTINHPYPNLDYDTFSDLMTNYATNKRLHS